MDAPAAEAGVWLAPLPPGVADCAPVADDPVLGEVGPADEAADDPVAEPTAWLTVDDAVLVAPEAVEAADCAAELAVDTTECVVELAVETADWTVEDTALVALDVETGGDGTETEGSPEVEPVLTDGFDTEGSPEARLADAPDPTMAAGASVRRQTRISDFARFMEVVLCAVNARGRENFWSADTEWGALQTTRRLRMIHAARVRLRSCL